MKKWERIITWAELVIFLIGLYSIIMFIEKLC